MHLLPSLLLLLVGPALPCEETASQFTTARFISFSNLKLSLSLSLSKKLMEMESPRRSASPEFEFWMVGNSHPELEPAGLLTADELFVDGVLLPLHLLSIPPDPNPEPKPKPAPSGFGSGAPEPDPPTKQQEEEESSPAAPASICKEASICSSNPPASLTSSSKRWKDIFKVGEKRRESAEEKGKKERKASNGGGSGSGGAAELNINIWPFSRSRSAGTDAGGRPKAAAMRKSSSAPCSRSNSRGENSAGRRWAASPGRPGVGVHVGRASPVWQVRRAGKGAEAAKGSRPKGGNRGLGLGVNSCIGYRNQVSCRGEGCCDGETAAANNANGSLFKFRALFSKKVY